MKRRDFLQLSLTALPALGLMPTFLSGCKREDLSPLDTDQRITIVGAGMAGLAAAWYFRQRGVTATVLESRDHIGGRTSTDRSAGFPFDRGASWIHGKRQNPIFDLAEQAGATTFKTDDEEVKVYNLNGSRYNDRDLARTEREFKEALEEVQKNGNALESFQTVFERRFPNRVGDRLWTYMLSAYLEFDTGADLDRLSSLDFDNDEAYGGPDLLVTNGYDRLADHLADGLDIRLNQVVQTIDHSGAAIQIVTDNDAFETDLLLVTVPLGVLKSGNLNFVPDLPDSLQGAIDRMEMGAINKYLLLWDSPFWDTELHYLGITPDQRGKFNYFLNARAFGNTNGLMTFTFGDYSLDAESLSDSEVTDAIMDHLRAVYPNASDPHTLLRTRWGSDPHAFGSYSFATNGTRSMDFDVLATPVGDKLFFAGEHTHRTYRGTVHGAYESGLREARRMAEVLGG